MPGTAFDHPLPVLDQPPDILGVAQPADAELLQLGVWIAGLQPRKVPLAEHEAIKYRQRAAVAGEHVAAGPSRRCHPGDEVAVEVRASRPVAEVAELAAQAPLGG